MARIGPEVRPETEEERDPGDAQPRGHPTKAWSFSTCQRDQRPDDGECEHDRTDEQLSLVDPGLRPVEGVQAVEGQAVGGRDEVVDRPGGELERARGAT